MPHQLVEASRETSAFRFNRWQCGLVDQLPSQVVTPRLLLRLWRPEDVPGLGAAIEASIEHLRPWMAWIRHEPLSDDERTQLINSGNEEWRNGGEANYGVFHDGVVVGGCGLHLVLARTSSSSNPWRRACDH